MLYHLLWRLNEKCNFDCEYCFRSGIDMNRMKENPHVGIFSPGYIANCFNKTGKTWRIHMTGGEPFLYPNFVDLAEALTARHYLSINTNLSTPNVLTFADRIPTNKVHAINASAHISELQKRKDGLENFIRNAIYMQDKGFNIRVLYITHPPLFSQMEKDLRLFKDLGVRNVLLKVYRGVYKGKVYPESFTDKEIKRILSQPISNYEVAILKRKIKFRDMMCDAGYASFDMDLSGNMTRCSGIKDDHGNLFAGVYRFNEGPSPCTQPECACPYQGMKHVIKEGLPGLDQTARIRTPRWLRHLAEFFS